MSGWILPGLLIARATSAQPAPEAAAQPEAVAQAAPEALAAGATPEAPAQVEGPTAALRDLSGPPAKLFRVTGGISLGEGVRFNNPYRLDRQLGDSAESLSLAAPYVDLAVAAAYGAPDGWQHGAALRLSIAMSGVAQQVLTPGYYAAYRGPHRAMAFARLGLPLVLAPDTNVGGEIGAGAAYFITGGVGVSAELIFDLFYGAGTPDVSYSVYPILSGQLGLIIDYEVLP